MPPVSVFVLVFAVRNWSWPKGTSLWGRIYLNL